MGRYQIRPLTFGRARVDRYVEGSSWEVEAFW